MVAASITGVFRLILIFLAIYYIAKLIRIFLLPWLLKKFITKAQQKMQDQMNQQFGGQGQYVDNEEGKIFVQTGPKSKKNKNSSSDDDFVEYEEIKD